MIEPSSYHRALWIWRKGPAWARDEDRPDIRDLHRIINQRATGRKTSKREIDEGNAISLFRLVAQNHRGKVFNYAVEFLKESPKVSGNTPQRRRIARGIIRAHYRRHGWPDIGDRDPSIGPDLTFDAGPVV